jgi:hypothetical protein
MIRRRPMTRPTKPLRRTKLRAVSQKRAKQQAAYAKLRVAFLGEHVTCELFCSLYPKPRRATEVHHAAGKEGALLTDVRHFKAACRECHTRLHQISPREAREHGFLYEVSTK